MANDTINSLEAAQTLLEQYSQAVNLIVEAAAGAVVRVERRGGDEHHGRWRMGRARVNHGSGVVVDAEQGHILTSYHVVSGTQDVRVHTASGHAIDGKRIGKDPDSDLALVKIDPAGLKLQAAKFGSSDNLKIGAALIALGNPDGDGVIATSGIVSALGQSLRGPSGQLMYGLIQTSALFNPGMSGGPLLNARGEIVGLNTASMVESQGINLAVASATIQKILPDLISFGVVHRPKLGIAGERQRIYEGLVSHHNLSQTHGVFVATVVEKSPAAIGGVQEGDIIITAGGQPVTGMDSLSQVLTRFKIGDDLPLRLIRKLDIVDVTLKLAGEGTNA